MQDWWKFDEVNEEFCILIIDFSKDQIDFVVSDLDKETAIMTVGFSGKLDSYG